MNYITAENLTKTYGIRTLFKDISFHINEGDKIALVARNGTGKTTLLRILTGQEPFDSGTLTINKEIQVVLFDQELNPDPEQSVQAFMMSLDSAPIRALREYRDSLLSDDIELAEKALIQMETHKAWDLENEMQQLLSQLKITHLETKMSQLSGGQIKRVALAKLLLETRAEHRHTLLIMDEPTNHLDIDMVEWLEAYLSKARLTLLLVTHDRYFLDSVCDTLFELEDTQLYIHRGAYADYLENKCIREENNAASVDKAQNLYRKELEWMRRQPKARTTKSKSRIDAFYETEKIAKTDLRKQSLELSFDMKRLGNKILELSNISKKYGDKCILDRFSYSFQRGEKIGIIGKNGVGKSTLLNILQGIEPPDSGKIETGETVDFGYFSQKGLCYPEEQRVIDFVKDIAEYYPLANGKSLSAAQFLRLFLFGEQTQYSPIAKLSGGEKRRLHLMIVLYQNPNFLIFDEPTNDLDLPTLTVLENFLQNFQGTLLIVSHDRYFMDRIVDHCLVFEGDGKISDFTGNFSEYREAQKQIKASITEKKTTPSPPAQQNTDKKNVKKKLSYREKEELEKIEKRLPQLEAQRDELSHQFNGAVDYEIISHLSTELHTLNEEIEDLEMRWIELSEKA